MLVGLSGVCAGSALPIVATSDPWCLGDATAARGFTVLALLAAIVSFVVSIMTALEIKTPTWNGEGKETTLVTSVVCSLFQVVALIPAVTMWQRMRALPRLIGGEVTPLTLRCFSDNVDEILSAIANKIDIDAIGSDGRNALHWALGNLDIVRLLAKYGANLNVQDRWGTTPLMLTVVGENKVAAELLIELGAVVDARNVSSSLTGPHLHQLGMVFLNAGSDLTIQDVRARPNCKKLLVLHDIELLTLLHLAAIHEQPKVLELIEDWRAGNPIVASPIDRNSDDDSEDTDDGDDEDDSDEDEEDD
ncbi:hypothetical protein BBJ28_00000205 [Nothophytophthora sp. Chile5]|nr:hypothetical protein BBJ28_00000205 [Nothophytophthora sp. Chile5]